MTPLVVVYARRLEVEKARLVGQVVELREATRKLDRLADEVIDDLADTCDCDDHVEQVAEYRKRIIAVRAVLSAAGTEAEPHEHEWIDARNEKVESGEMCLCGAGRSGNAEDGVASGSVVEPKQPGQA